MSAIGRHGLDAVLEQRELLVEENCLDEESEAMGDNEKSNRTVLLLTGEHDKKRLVVVINNDRIALQGVAYSLLAELVVTCREGNDAYLYTSDTATTCGNPPYTRTTYLRLREQLGVAGWLIEKESGCGRLALEPNQIEIAPAALMTHSDYLHPLVLKKLVDSVNGVTA